jgi:hypothetical protein
MVANASQHGTADRFAQAEPLQHADAGRKDALGARLVARKAPLLEQLHLESGAPEQDRERRSGDAASADDHLRHSSPGTKRGL